MNVVDFLKGKKTPKAPWSKYYTRKEMNIKIPNISLYELIKLTANKYPNNYAINYYSKKITYKELMISIEKCSKAFRSQGIRKGDIVTICMPDTPEALISFYALNKIGAISNMIHPLSGEEEIKEYLNSANSVMLIMIDICYEKIKNIIKDTSVYKTIIVSAKDSMPYLLGLGYQITKGFKVQRPKSSEEYIYFRDFIHKGERYNNEKEITLESDDPAVILHSGGTTGTPKGIVLSNGNFNALALQSDIVFKNIIPSDKILAIMPVFHGFGLGVSIHAPLHLGMEVILVPQFNAKKFDKLLEKYQPHAILGVPTLYEALTNTKNDKLNLSNLKYAISGGDTLPKTLSRRVNIFLKEHASNIEITQGYGMSESLAATALSYGKANKEGSIGIPFPGNYFKIINPNTREEVDLGEEGEICVSGPTIMLGYLNNEKETNEVLQIHNDKNIWLHTGDIGYMDSDGILFYTQRLKRMIVSSGYNVYPSRVEQIIEEHPSVMKCTVIGIPHPYKQEVAKAFIVLKNGYTPLKVRHSIKEHCEKNLAQYSIPYEFEYRKSLPKTLIGKIDLKKLESENNERK